MEIVCVTGEGEASEGKSSATVSKPAVDNVSIHELHSTNTV